MKMSGPIEEAVHDARQARTAGDLAAADIGYSRAADLARIEGDQASLAHALRHLSDISRESGSLERALATGREAVCVYRAYGGASPVDLANAMRLNALALERLGRSEEAAPLWREARRLYQLGNVPAGVEECDSHLGPAPKD